MKSLLRKLLYDENTKRVYYSTFKKCVFFIKSESSTDYWNNLWYSKRMELKKFGAYRKILHVKNVQLYINSNTDRIIEAGCGNGKLVFQLSNMGYQCIGTDFVTKTLKNTKKWYNQLDLISSDLNILPFKDEIFTIYISIGVIEHFWDGFDMIVKEAYRVLKPKGYLYITFPYMSPIRRLKAKLMLYNSSDANLKPSNFYQFALCSKSTQNKILSYNFKLVQKFSYNSTQGIKEEAPLLWDAMGNTLKKILKYCSNIIALIPPFSMFNHSMVMIFQKREND